MKMKLVLVLVTLLSGNLLFSQTGFDNNEGKVFTDIKEALKDRQRVFHLNLSGRGLKAIPKEVELFENLRTLDLSKNKLKTIKGIDFSKLPKLEGLNLYQNQLGQIPAILYEINNLQRLNLGANQIREISDDINNWKFLTALKLHHNQITHWPASIALKYLETIQLNANKLETLPIALFEQNPSLERLNVNDNQLKAFPEISPPTNLKVLNLGANNITDLGGLSQLYELQELIMDWNILDQAAVEAISKLPRLQILSMEHCGLKALPEAIGNLKSLRQLSLIANELEEIPQVITDLKKLENLWIGGNKIDKEQAQEVAKSMKRVEIKV